MSTTTDVCLYHLKVLLLDISPMLWRRLLVRSDSTIADLHHNLHIAIGWTDTHLHQFRIHGKKYGQSPTESVCLEGRALAVVVTVRRTLMKVRVQVIESDSGVTKLGQDVVHRPICR